MSKVTSNSNSSSNSSSASCGRWRAGLVVALAGMQLSLMGCRDCRSSGSSAAAATDADVDHAADAAGPEPRSTLLGGERGIDHVGVAVGDLQAAQRTYHELLGFDRPTAGKLPNGIQNINYYFEDATYLETLNAWDDEKVAWLASFIRRFKEGGVFLVLSVRSAVDTTAFLEQRGIRMTAPVDGRIEVAGKPGGTWKTLFFDRSPLPGNPIYFIEYPLQERRSFLGKLESEQIRRRFFRHRNTATGIRAVWLAVTDLDRAVAAYDRIGLAAGRRIESAQLRAEGRIVEAGQGKIVLWMPTAGQNSPLEAFNSGRGPGVLGMTIAVKSIVVARQLLSKNLGRELASYAGPFGTSVLLPPELTHGVWLEFAQPSGP